MRFTEHEMTAGLTACAKAVVASQRRGRRKREDVEEMWEQMGRFQRFTVLDQLGSQVLPVLVALPDVEVEPGTRPAFTDAQITEAVEGQLGEEGGRLKRAVLVKGRVELVKIALAAMPPRQDPDALIVPDHL